MRTEPAFSHTVTVSYPVPDWQEPTVDQLTKGWTVEPSIKNVPAHLEVQKSLRAVRDQIVSAMRDQMFTNGHVAERVEYVANQVLVALEEVIVNAMHHGNQTDSNKTITVRWELEPHRLHVEIEDQGAGFDVEAQLAYDPRAPENIERLGRRGLMLTKEFMTDVAWHDGGRRVRMMKQLTEQEEAAEELQEAG